MNNFTAKAQQRGDAIVLMVACAGSRPSAVSVSAPGWSFAPLGPIVGATRQWAASFGAIAPDTESAMVAVSWTGSDCEGSTAVLGDEFTNTDPAGEAVTFDAHAETTGTGVASAVVTTANPDDAVWAACVSSGTLTAVGDGYTKAADNSSGDWSEYRIVPAPAGTSEEPRFMNASGNEYAMTAVTLKPR